MHKVHISSRSQLRSKSFLDFQILLLWRFFLDLFGKKFGEMNRCGGDHSFATFLHALEVFESITHRNSIAWPWTKERLHDCAPAHICKSADGCSSSFSDASGVPVGGSCLDWTHTCSQCITVYQYHSVIWCASWNALAISNISGVVLKCRDLLQVLGDVQTCSTWPRAQVKRIICIPSASFRMCWCSTRTGKLSCETTFQDSLREQLCPMWSSSWNRSCDDVPCPRRKEEGRWGSKRPLQPYTFCQNIQNLVSPRTYSEFRVPWAW